MSERNCPAMNYRHNCQTNRHRFLLVNMSIDPVFGGGTAERTRQLARHLILKGALCSLMTLAHRRGNGFMEAEIASAGVRVIAFPVLNWRFYIPLIDPFHLWRAVRNADVVHIMNHWILLNTVVYLTAALAGKPVVLCPAGALRIYGRSKKIKKAYARLIGDRMIRKAALVIIISENERASVLAIRNTAPVSLIPNGVDPAEFTDRSVEAFRKRYGLPSDGKLILFMGRLNPIKGPDLLLDAFSFVSGEFKRHHLVFAGPDGGMMQYLEASTARLGLEDRVHFIGYVEGAVKSQAYYAADLLVVPSRQEAMSIVALEAGITGTPVLLTDACGFGQIESVGGGLSVQPTAGDIANGLKKLLNDPNSLVSKGKMLHAYVAKHYTWDAIVQQHLSCFNDLLQ